MIKRFIKYYKPHIPLFTLDMICALIVSLCNLVYPRVASSIVGGFETGDMNTDRLITLAAILLGVYVLKAICQSNAVIFPQCLVKKLSLLSGRVSSIFTRQKKTPMKK